MKVGLKETLTLISKGYTKKEIEALADIDAADEQKAKEASAEEAKEEKTSEPATEEVDYKKLYEELKQKNDNDQAELKKKDETIKKIQKENVNENNLPDYEQNKEDSMKSLKEALRSFY